MSESLTLTEDSRVRLLNAIASASLLWAVLAAIVLGSGLILAAGLNPVDAYRRIFEGAFGGLYQLSVTVRFFIPLCLAGLAVAIPHRCGLFNIGGEGQLILGAVAATYVALFVPAPAYLHIPLALLAAGAAGAVWAAIPALMLAYRNVNEVLSTVMMNFVAAFIVQYLVRSVWRSSDAMFPVTADFPDTAQFATFGATMAWHTGLYVTLLALVAAMLVVSKSSFGFSMRILASGAQVARNIGIPIRQTIVIAMLTGGVFAGLAGATEVMGVQHNLSPQFSPGYGFTAVMIAMLSAGSPLRVCAIAFLFAALRNGVSFMQRTEGVPSAIGQVIIALVVIFFAVETAHRYFVNRVRAR
ncbi:MAG TPA: ABC transporter permease [Bauldia sp.]|nr:ABC transporter permease [Bauldia sp.]